jgi:hypothetical protein
MLTFSAATKPSSDMEISMNTIAIKFHALN